MFVSLFLLYWLLYFTVDDISVIFVATHRCTYGLKMVWPIVGLSPPDSLACTWGASTDKTFYSLSERPDTFYHAMGFKLNNTAEGWSWGHKPRPAAKFCQIHCAIVQMLKPRVSHLLRHARGLIFDRISILTLTVYDDDPNDTLVGLYPLNGLFNFCL